jgi:hypothetical protein
MPHASQLLMVVLATALADGGGPQVLDGGTPTPGIGGASASPIRVLPAPAIGGSSGPAISAMPAPAVGAHQAVIPLENFKVFTQDSGPVNYYEVVSEGDTKMIRGVYTPPLGNVVLYAETPDKAWHTVKQVSWRWRVHALPKDANDCGPGFSDNAASVFLAFKAGIKIMVIKYAWSTLGTPGTSCQSSRGWFFDRDTVLLRTGGPLNVWESVEVDPRVEFVKHYGGKLQDVPDFVGLGLMTDGDNSQSPAEGDYADFTVRW